MNRFTDATRREAHEFAQDEASAGRQRILDFLAAHPGRAYGPTDFVREGVLPLLTARPRVCELKQLGKIAAVGRQPIGPRSSEAVYMIADDVPLFRRAG